MFGLVAVVALALTAAVGVGTASAAATTLCKNTTYAPYCGEGDRYVANTALEASTPKKTKILTGFGTIECNSSLQGKTGEEGGGSLPVSISSWTFTSCNIGCEVSFKELPSGSLGWGEGSNGTLALRVGANQPQLELNCPVVGEHCVYAFPDLPVKGGNPAQLTASAIKMPKVSGEFCLETEKEAQLTVTYNVNAPTPAYVAKPVLAKEHLRLCEDSLFKTCQSESTYPVGTAISSSASNLKVDMNTVYISCNKATIGTSTLAIGASPFPLGSTTFTASECIGAGTKCTLTQKGTANSQIAEISYNKGAFQSTAISFETSCETIGGPRLRCTYTALVGYIHGDESNNPAAITYTNAYLDREGPECAPVAALTATFKISTPTPLYLL